MKIRRTVRLDDEDDFDDFEDGDDFDDYEEMVDDAPQRSLSTGTTVQVSNLDEEVTEDDIEELFSAGVKGGPDVALKSAVVNYNREGKSNGTATVVFSRRQDALKAIQEYNGVPLDGKPMQLAMVGGAPAPAAKPSMASRMGRSQASPRAAPRQAPREERYEQPRGSFGGRGRGKGGKGGGRGKGNDRKPREQKPPVSADDLDAGLDDYFNN